MNLGADLAATLPYLRAQAESRMTETVEFFTTVETVVDLETTNVDTVLHTGPGRVKYSDTIGSDAESGGQFPVVGRREVHVPVGSYSAKPDVFVRVTASTSDASLVGRVFRVAERATAGQVTAWRHPVEEVS